jgi:hypothetical protein
MQRGDLIFVFTECSTLPPGVVDTVSHQIGVRLEVQYLTRCR